MDDNFEVIFQHIPEESREDVKRILDIANITARRKTINVTDFFDPFTIDLFKSVLNRYDELKYLEFGGYENFEKSALIVYPDFLNDIDFTEYFSALKFEFPNESIRHKDILGSIYGLGIDISKIGDIYIVDDISYIVCKSEVEEYLLYNLIKIGRLKPKASKINLADLPKRITEYKYRDISVNSLRLDTVVAGAFNLSRNVSKNMIDKGLVKLNHQTVTKANYEVKKGDLISARRKGRVLINSEIGMSKKGRIRINLAYPI
ncbi:MAG: YlmH/Sll1252 family protein [Tissierellia bacterium]|nr:YlmH/Sll1252 family protein [Tissierellia bacterium]